MADKSTLIEEKKNIRKKINIIKKKLVSEKIKKEQLDTRLIEKLISTDLYKHSDNIFCYVGMKDEIDTSRFIKIALEDGKKVSVPKVTGKITMDAVITDSLDKLKPVKPYGILESIDDKEKMERIDLIIVPGVAFDNEGGRIGHGAGYYDFFIKQHKEAHTIAMCYDFQLLDKVPEEKHDVRIEKIIF